ncbi:MAG: hypothetical protein K0R47_4794 [Brevibacillus sp.]|nr:hypothetical protein [Brevibacillus sp.]
MKKKFKKMLVVSMSLTVLALGSAPAFADTHRTDLYLTTSGGKLAAYADSSMSSYWDAIYITNDISINGATHRGNSVLGAGTYASTPVVYTDHNYDPNKTYRSDSTHNWKNNEDQGYWGNVKKFDLDL